jgi:hypothetical protein
LFHKNPQAPIDVISTILHVDQHRARETYLLSRPAFTHNGIVSEKGAFEYLKSDAERLKLKEPLPFSQAFDFSLYVNSTGRWESNSVQRHLQLFKTEVR